VAKDKKKAKDVNTEGAEPKVKKSKDKGAKSEAADELDADDDLDPKGPGDGFRIADALNKLVLVIPTAIRRDFKTSNGATDTIVADVIVLDEEKPKKSERHNGTLIFQAVLVGSLEDRIGKGMVAAKLVKGEAKNGNSAPYLFEKSDEAKTAARTYLASVGPKLD
jgi:hypothetical protein